MGGRKVQGKDPSNLPWPNFTPAFTFPLSWPMKNP